MKLLYFNVEKHKLLNEKTFTMCNRAWICWVTCFYFIKKKFKVIGFDLNKKRVSNLNKLIDANNEFKKKELKLSNGSKITNYENELKNCNFFIVTVPLQLNKINFQTYNILFLHSKLFLNILKMMISFF